MAASDRPQPEQRPEIRRPKRRVTGKASAAMPGLTTAPDPAIANTITQEEPHG